MKDDYWAAINWQSQRAEAGAEARGSPEAGSNGVGRVLLHSPAVLDASPGAGAQHLPAQR